MAGGELQVDGLGLIVGTAGTGSFEQTGGVVTTPVLTMGASVGASGSYVMSGADTALGTPVQPLQRLIVGESGSGTFRIEGGTIHAGDILVGGWFDSITNTAYVGNGVMTQTGGVVTTNGLYLGTGPNAVYNLEGGTLISSFGSLGDANTGTVFNHSGGTNRNTGLFIVGNSGGAPEVIYNMSGSAVAEFADLWVGGFAKGVLNMSSGSITATSMAVGDGPFLGDPLTRGGVISQSVVISPPAR